MNRVTGTVTGKRRVPDHFLVIPNESVNQLSRLGEGHSCFAIPWVARSWCAGIWLGFSNLNSGNINLVMIFLGVSAASRFATLVTVSQSISLCSQRPYIVLTPDTYPGGASVVPLDRRQICQGALAPAYYSTKAYRFPSFLKLYQRCLRYLTGGAKMAPSSV